ncbi:hypothetical protein Nepgr_002902 [Nepenthes gracilis]|uniref:Pentatricopeptide repeat-containing protein n=1 Tax=Nepenthes gracilis TaxID=150966 RepID=A0AAD3P7U9_NEPGR|nr:hypothetical protein Nepgr_002902 [Nepenthes gracilis]
MRGEGFFPNSNMIALVLNAYGKEQEFEKANAVYEEMQEEGCAFSDEVHFQMLSLCGARGDFDTVGSLFERGLRERLKEHKLVVSLTATPSLLGRALDAPTKSWFQPTLCTVGDYANRWKCRGIASAEFSTLVKNPKTISV